MHSKYYPEKAKVKSYFREYLWRQYHTEFFKTLCKKLEQFDPNLKFSSNAVDSKNINAIIKFSNNSILEIMLKDIPRKILEEFDVR